MFLNMRRIQFSKSRRQRTGAFPAPAFQQGAQGSYPRYVVVCRSACAALNQTRILTRSGCFVNPFFRGRIATAASPFRSPRADLAPPSGVTGTRLYQSVSALSTPFFRRPTSPESPRPLRRFRPKRTRILTFQYPHVNKKFTKNLRTPQTASPRRPNGGARPLLNPPRSTLY